MLVYLRDGSALRLSNILVYLRDGSALRLSNMLVYLRDGSALRLSNMLVYLRDGSAQTSVHAVTLMCKLQIRLSLSSSPSLPTPGRPFPELTVKSLAHGRVATGVPILKSLV